MSRLTQTSRKAKITQTATLLHLKSISIRHNMSNLEVDGLWQQKNISGSIPVSEDQDYIEVTLGTSSLKTGGKNNIRLISIQFEFLWIWHESRFKSHLFFHYFFWNIWPLHSIMITRCAFLSCLLLMTILTFNNRLVLVS